MVNHSHGMLVLTMALDAAIVQQVTVAAHALAVTDEIVDLYHLDAVGCGLEEVVRSDALAVDIRSVTLATKMLDVVLDAPSTVAGEGMDLVIIHAELFHSGLRQAKPAMELSVLRPRVLLRSA